MSVVIADTNVILRFLLRDDIEQADVVLDVLKNADQVVISVHTLCEIVWVLQRGYKITKAEIIVFIHRLLSIPNLHIDRQIVMAGLHLLELGGDFSDGVIAYDGFALDGQEFISFDKKAIKLLTQQGYQVRLLSAE